MVISPGSSRQRAAIICRLIFNRRMVPWPVDQSRTDYSVPDKRDKQTNKTNTFLLLPQASISNFAAGLGSPQTRIVPGHSVELGDRKSVV